MKKTTDLSGSEAYHAWMTSPQFAGFEKNVSPEYVMRVFLPPVPQSDIQMEMPLPQRYQQWLASFKAAQWEDKQQMVSA